MDDAMAQFQKALEIHPGYAQAYYNIGYVFLQKGQLDEAITCLEKVLQIQPDYVNAVCNLGAAYLQKGRLDEAIEQYQKAVALQPDSAEAHHNLGYALLQRGKARGAIAHYQTALEIEPDNPYMYNALAWVLATWPEASVRNGVKAIALAEQANRLSGGKNPLMMKTVAAAYAAAGRFPEAVTMGRQALQVASDQSNAPLVETIQAQIELYLAGQPSRYAAPTNTLSSPSRP